jgi:hypothetical protein
MDSTSVDTVTPLRRGFVVACRYCNLVGKHLVATRTEADELALLHNTQIHGGQLHLDRPPASAQPFSRVPRVRGRRRAAVRAILRGIASTR